MPCQDPPKISIIIPTLNEEKYLPLLLDSIKKQNFPNYEIIVAEAGSRDRTVEIARKYGCQIVKGGPVAQGRNIGAENAESSLLLFLDADVLLPDYFLEKTLKEFKEKKLEIAGFFLAPSSKNKTYTFLFNFFYNLPIFLLEKILPHVSQGILIEKLLFEKINGFDEKIKLAEDHDLARRARKFGRYGIIKSSKIFVSERRFRKDGWFKTYLKYLLCEIHMIFLGPVKSDIFKYKFNHYSKNQK